MDILNSVKDTRVKCYNIPNGGPAKARNYGLKKALGEYIQFIDADDYLDQDGVEILVSKVNNCDMVIAGYRIVGKDIYNIQIVNIEDEVINAMYRIPHVIDIERNEEDFIIKFENGINNLSNLLNFIAEHNLTYIKLYSQLPTLNDVFLELTGKELRD